MTSTIRQNKIQDGVDATLLVGVNSSNELKVHDETLANKISTANVRVASTLAAGAVYQGTGEVVTGYGRAGISITSSNQSNGVLTIEVSLDGVTYGGPDRNFSDTRFAQPHMWEIVEPYFRIKYTNGTIEATNLAITVQFSNNGGILLGHQLDESLIDETEAIITRSVLVGKKDNGDYLNVPLSDNGELLTKGSDANASQIMGDMLKELKKMNLQMCLMTDTIIKDSEVN